VQNFTVDTSDDGTTWVTAKQFTAVVTSAVQNFVLDTPVHTRYVRWSILTTYSLQFQPITSCFTFGGISVASSSGSFDKYT
jgi:hypothetical protein